MSSRANSRFFLAGGAVVLLACQGVIPGEPDREASPPEQHPPNGAAGSVSSNGTAGSTSPNGGSGRTPDPGSADGGAEATPPAPAQFACDRAAEPPELPLPRLSRAQLANTLRFAITRALPGEASAIWSKVATTFEQYPIDQRVPAPGDLKGGYSRTDQSIQQSQVDAMYAVGLSIAQELTASASRFGAFMGSCASDTNTANDRACLEKFVRSWGSRVMRFALSDADVAYFADIAGATPVDRAAVSDVIVTILNSPELLYRVEHGIEDKSAVSPLSAYELAARLSYQFWQAPPDDALWEAAANGSLLTEQGFAAELERLLSSPEAQSSLDEFVGEWLRLDELPSLEALRDDPVYRAFAREPLPTDVTRAAMLEDVRLSLRHTLRSGGSASDFLNDRRSYTEDAALAAIYGVVPWDGKGTPPTFSSKNRAGLLGRAALLATGTASTRPIHKGYLIRNALLCEQVGSPPPNAASMPPAPTDTLTTREAVTRLTSGGSCGGCHDRAINPQGFVLEGFDALGRERDEERLFDERGKVTGSEPIDTTADVTLSSATFRVSTPVELTRRIDDSELFESCLARHYFRFAQGRVESPSGDGCLLSAMESAARSGAPLAEMLKLIATDTTFKSRRFQ